MLRNGMKLKKMFGQWTIKLCLTLSILGCSYADIISVKQLDGTTYAHADPEYATHFIITIDQARKIEATKQERDYLYQLVTDGAGQCDRRWSIIPGVSNVNGAYIGLEYKL